MRKSQIVEQLLRISKVFISHGHTKTSKWIDFIAENVNNDGPSDYLQDYKDVVQSLETEISTNRTSRQIQEEISRIIGTKLYADAIAKNVPESPSFSKVLLDSEGSLQRWGMTLDHLGTIEEFAIRTYKEGRIKESFYLLCFSYMLDIGGSYEEILRILYCLTLTSRNLTMPKDIFNRRLRNRKGTGIEDEMKRLGVSDALFKFYFHGHLRNSIAHSRFSYDISTQRMSFYDISEGFRIRLSFMELVEISHGIREVSHIFTDYIHLLRIRDLIKSKIEESLRPERTSDDRTP
jgi:hypothetical protein